MKYEIESGERFQSLNKDSIKTIESIITWRVSHKTHWYRYPGRTCFVYKNGLFYKIKGAGFHNPPGLSFSGLKRSITPIPENDIPHPPLEQAFKRDIVHVDPSNTVPHVMESVHSQSAPIGGMTYKTAKNDLLIFQQLLNNNLPCNRPVAVYKYKQLYLDDEQMGVSVSILPADALFYSPYDVYLGWAQNRFDNNSLLFFKDVAENEQFNIRDAVDRLQLLTSLANFAGSMIRKFSTDAGLYRFSGSPDNWSMKTNIYEPLYFSDVDTCQTLASIPTSQHIWEVIRNLLTALHQWTYYFIPCLTYPESGYSVVHWRRNDFLRSMITGFFDQASDEDIEVAVSKLWNFLNPTITKIDENCRLPLRRGEHYLQKTFPRPMFYFVTLAILTDLIRKSRLPFLFSQESFDLDFAYGYIRKSSSHTSHSLFFSNYDYKMTMKLVDKYIC